MKNRINDEGKIVYPCMWLYKVIGKDRDKMQEALTQILGDRDIDMSFSNISNKGNYLAFNIELLVDSEILRDEIYAKLKAHPDIKAVL